MQQSEFETLAEFRDSLRRFLKFSEASAEASGISPQAYQALLAIKGQNPNKRLSVGELAQCLLIKHNSAVGLADRLSAQGYIMREADKNDRRRVFLFLTPSGDALVTEVATRNMAKLIEMRGDMRNLLDRLQELSGK